MNSIKIISSLSRMISLCLVLIIGLIILLGATYEPAFTENPIDPKPPLKLDTENPFADLPGYKLFYDWGCNTCHAMDRKLVGPALAGVTERRDKTWIYQFIQNSSRMIANGDPTAVGLFKEYNQLQMPSHELSTQEIDDILSYIEAAGKQ